MTDTQAFRTAMSKFATGVTVVTSTDREGHPHSMTANSFTSVCLDPPTVLVCVAHSTHTHDYVSDTGRFGINILTEDQEDLGAYFAKRPEDRSGDIQYNYDEGDGGVPVLVHSMVFFGCKVVDTHVYGDHTVYLGEVTEVRQKDEDSDAPLMFYRSRWYHPVRD